MKRLLLSLSPVALLALGGCASVSPTTAATDDIDKERVAAIEAAARSTGVQVHWVNYPRKKAER